MAEGAKEGQPLKSRLADLFTDLPAPLVTLLAALLSELPPAVDHDAHDDILQEKAASLLSEMVSAYIAGDNLANLWHPKQECNFPSLSELSFALCSVVSNPSARKAQSAKDEGGNFGAANLQLASPPQGKRKVLPSWCVEYLHEKPSKHELRLVEEIKAGPQKLASIPGGVVVSHDVDFGIQRAAAQTSQKHNAYGLPIIPEVPRYFRTVLVSNQGTSEVLLLDVRSVPHLPNKLRLHDDFITVARESDSLFGKDAPDSVGVSLAPGAQYQVTVELRCVPQDAAHLQQWLLLSFIPAAAANAAKPANASDQVFVIGRRISALIAKSLADMQTILSVEALPFFPAALRTLFNTPPATFLVGEKPALLKSTRLFDLLSSSSPPPAYKQMGALSLEPETPFTLSANQDLTLWQPPPMATFPSLNTDHAGGITALPPPLQEATQPLGPEALDYPPAPQLGAPALMPLNPTHNQTVEPVYAPLPPLQAFTQFPYQQMGPIPPFQPFVNMPPPISHPPFIPLPQQPFPLPPNSLFHEPFLYRPNFAPVPNSIPAPLATVPANPMGNHHFPPLGSPSSQQQANPAPLPQRFPPMSPTHQIPQAEIQQMIFWLTAQIAQTMERTAFATPHQAAAFHHFLRQSADYHLQNHIRERTLQLLNGTPAQHPGPLVLGQGGFTPTLHPGPFPLAAQSVPIPTPLPGTLSWDSRPASAPAGRGGSGPAEGPAVTSPTKAPNEKPPPGTPSSDRAAELGLPHDLSPEPVSILTTSEEGKVRNKDTGVVADGMSQPSLAERLQQTASRSKGKGTEGTRAPDAAAESDGSQASEKPGVPAGVCACRDRQVRQLSRLLALEETAMEKDIKAHDLFNTRLKMPTKSAADTGTAMHLLALEVPGLPENRPSVLYADVVYLRLASAPQVEFAAFVWAVEMRPAPQVLLAISESLVTVAKVPVGTVAGETAPAWVQALVKETVHARFTFDRLLLKRMHVALAKASLAPFPLLPCTCQPTSPSSLPSSSNVDNADSSTRPHSSFKSKSAHANGNVKSEKLPATEKDWADSFTPINGKLNWQQRQAVGSILAGSCGRGPYIIFGPPGTGKTVTMVETCLQLLRLDGSSGIRLCVCAPSNFAADLVCSGIAAGGIGPDVMWRLNDPRRTLASVKQDVVGFCKYDTATGLFCVAASPSSYRVIVCTCGAAALLQEPPLADAAGPFTHILIDEAGQALVPETLIAFGLATKDTKLALCGDPRQLGPVVHSQVAAQHGLAQSLLEGYMKAAAASPDGPGLESNIRSEPTFAQADILRRLLPRESNLLAAAKGGDTAHSHRTHVVKLVHNYRSHRKLLELPSRMFYKDELVATAEASSVEPPRHWDEMQGSEFPMLFYGVKGQQMREGEAPSYFNPLEAERLVNLLAGLLQRAHISTGDVGVMAPYRKQVQKLRLLLRERGLGAVRVGTVDDYQGQEERVIFISTVLTRPESLRRGAKQGPDSSIGFLGNAKRFNVAITRAKALLVVVGHPVVLLEDENWSQLLRYCLQRDAYRGAGSEMVPRYVRHGANDWTEGPDEEDDEGDDDIAEAVGRIAELSLLGMGDMDRQFPEGLDSEYSAFSEDLEWRVVL